MRGKRLVALLLSGIMTVSLLVGCGGIDKNAVVATLDGKEITLGLANFTAKMMQANYDDMYVAYFGKDYWSADLYGDGSTMEQNLKNNVINNLRGLYTLVDKMDEYDVELSDEEKDRITQVATQFMADNSEEALNALGADLEIVKEYLTLMTIQLKMYTEIVADAKITISDEDANTSSYSYIRLSKSTYKDEKGNKVEHTTESLADLKEDLEEFIKQAKLSTFKKVANYKRYEYSVYDSTFTKDTTSIDKTVHAVLKELDDGDISNIIETDSYYYVVCLNAVTDEKATEERRESLKNKKEGDFYGEALEEMEEGQEWKVNTKVWAKVTFKNLFTTYTTDSETTEGTTETSPEN